MRSLASFSHSARRSRPSPSSPRAHAPEPSSSAGPGQYAVSLTSVTGLSVPLGAVSAQICVEGAAARYTDDGSTPSATIGIPVTAGQCFDFAGPLAAFKIIGSGATLDISYYSGIE